MIWMYKTCCKGIVFSCTSCSRRGKWEKWAHLGLSIFVFWLSLTNTESESETDPNNNLTMKHCLEGSSVYFIHVNCEIGAGAPPWHQEAQRGLKKGLPEGCGSVPFYEIWHERGVVTWIVLGHLFLGHFFGTLFWDLFFDTFWGTFFWDLFWELPEVMTREGGLDLIFLTFCGGFVESPLF